MGLEAVELIQGWENAFGIRLSDAEAWTLHSSQDAIALISAKLVASATNPGVCLGQRAYHRLRHAFCAVTGASRASLQLDCSLRALLPKTRPDLAWTGIGAEAGLTHLPKLRLGVGRFFMPITVRDLVTWSVAHCPQDLVGEDERWTTRQVRAVVRAVVQDVTGLEQFADHDEFVRDLGID